MVLGEEVRVRAQVAWRGRDASEVSAPAPADRLVGARATARPVAVARLAPRALRPGSVVHACEPALNVAALVPMPVPDARLLHLRCCGSRRPDRMRKRAGVE